MGIIEPGSDYDKYPLWVQMSNTSISKDVQDAGQVVMAHAQLYGIEHLPCAVRNEQQGYKARCCICAEHSPGCLLHVRGGHESKR